MDNAWIARRQRAASPETVALATKAQIEAPLIAAALAGGAPCAGVLADALHDAGSRISRMLEGRAQPYALTTGSNHHLRFLAANAMVQPDPAALADALPGAARAGRVAPARSTRPSTLALTNGRVASGSSSSRHASCRGSAAGMPRRSAKATRIAAHEPMRDRRMTDTRPALPTRKSAAAGRVEGQ